MKGKVMNKILVVDDSPLNIRMLELGLSKDYKIFAAKNGMVAASILEKNVPDIILLDIVMPVMDGYQTYEYILEKASLKGIPVLFLSSVETLDVDLRAKDPDRFVGFLKKPLNMQEVKQTIIQALSGGTNG
ncbi:response regulator [Fusibacter paucivorans]|uniref:Stage 0 sporulation protein A homolog n=2 Tax=Fusibacter paucivorans TaxID=76009 RepID=A0ABS5PUE8_9FIRM|nr:response regulator [Fusibacter paucivorans]